jgi:hypothetical protein
VIKRSVFFFLTLMAKLRVAIALAVVLLLVAALGASPRVGVVPGEMGWWDWTYFFIGVLLFLSLGAMVLVHFFESDLVLCGEPGVVPAWALLFGFAEVVMPSADAPPLPTSSSIYHGPKQRLYPFTCQNCGAGSEVPYIGSPCPFCGEAPASGVKKRSISKGGSSGF